VINLVKNTQDNYQSIVKSPSSQSPQRNKKETPKGNLWKFFKSQEIANNEFCREQDSWDFGDISGTTTEEENSEYNSQVTNLEAIGKDAISSSESSSTDVQNLGGDSELCSQVTNHEADGEEEEEEENTGDGTWITVGDTSEAMGANNGSWPFWPIDEDRLPNIVTTIGDTSSFKAIF